MIRVMQDEEEEVPEEILAVAITRISEAMTDLVASGLNERAIVTLVHDDTKIAKRTIVRVLQSLRELRDTYCE